MQRNNTLADLPIPLNELFEMACQIRTDSDCLPKMLPSLVPPHTQSVTFGVEVAELESGKFAH